jgi:hypothetical protein
MTEPTQLNAAAAANPAAGLTDLAAKIKTLHSQVVDAGKGVVRKAIDAGLALIQAKAQVPHGSWLKWLKDNCSLSERTAEDYMAIARNRQKAEAIIATVANMTLGQVLRNIKGKSEAAGGAGSLSRYEKAQTALIKSLGKLPSEDVVEAAESTIDALQRVLAEKKTTAKAA